MKTLTSGRWYRHDLPVRIRQYRRMAMDPEGLASVKSQMEFKLWGHKPAVKERRRMHDVVDEEGTSAIQEYAAERFAARRKQKRVQMEQTENFPPVFREKLKDLAFAESKSLVIRVVVDGNPEPKITWYRNEAPLERNPRTSLHHTSETGTYTLNVSPALASDAGESKCVARNRLGEVACRARLEVGTPPDPPGWPIVERIGHDHVHIHWEYPSFDGNSEVLVYKTEYRSRNDNSWNTYSEELINEKVTVRNLQPGTFYRFRVAAHNIFGWSTSSYSSEEIRTLRPDDLHGHDLNLQASSSLAAPQVMPHHSHIRRPSGAETEVPTSRKPAQRIPGSFEKVSISLSDGDPNEQHDFRKEIARGQFSVIFRCMERKTASIYAAKVIDSFAPDALNEYETLRSLKHDRIAELYKATRINSEYMVLIMDKLDGMDILTYLCQRDQYSEEDVSVMMRQTLDALQYLHLLGIAHLNLQPDNIVLETPWKASVKLIDFGSARRVPEEGVVVRNLTTPLEYRAPEIVTNRVTGVQADIWSMGVLVFIPLSGVSPFRGEDDEETTTNIRYVRYRIAELYHGLTAEASRFIMQALKAIPGNRLTVDECLEHRWITPTELNVIKREKTVFNSLRLSQFRRDYQQHRQRRQLTSDAIAQLFRPSSPPSSVVSESVRL